MNRVASGILLLLLLVQGFFPLAIVGWYVTNKTYVATVLCENRDKPQLHCDGKCVLSQKLKKAGDQEKKAGYTIKIEILPYTITETYNSFQPVFVALLNRTGRYTDHYHFSPVHTFFHPPQA